MQNIDTLADKIREAIGEIDNVMPKISVAKYLDLIGDE